jgi:hypothetical protein
MRATIKEPGHPQSDLEFELYLKDWPPKEHKLSQEVNGFLNGREQVFLICLGRGKGRSHLSTHRLYISLGGKHWFAAVGGNVMHGVEISIIPTWSPAHA